MSVKINSLELENVKRVKAVTLEPTANGLTVIGGKNNQGKTSVLDAITWALGGDKHRPSNAKRDGSMVDPYIRIELSNGLVVERKGKNSDLKVSDPTGKRAGQKLLDSFISQFALDLPKFLNQTSQEKAKTLLQIIGVGDKLSEFDRQEASAYNRRVEIGRIAKQKKNYADEMKQWDGVPDEPVSASDLISQQQEILRRNAQRQQWANDYHNILNQMLANESRTEELSRQIAELKAQHKELEKKAKEASKSPKEMEMESTAELEASIEQIDAINAKIRDNLNKAKALDEANEYQRQYDALTVDLEQIRKDRMNLLDGVDMPLKDLTVQNGELVYHGQPWDNMSGSDQLKVATSIVRKLNPNCGFVLVDKLEQMDGDTMKEFGTWAETEQLQVIGTRVTAGSDCDIYISDGYSAEPAPKVTAPAAAPTWTPGKF